MSQENSASSSNAPSTWTEPPWSGWIETTGDALLILEAARRGLIPRVTRRLVDSERKMITSGSVFVFDEDESGIKRWTDGFFWSPSRILGNFLLYRETEKRGAGHRSARQERDDYNEGTKGDGAQSLSRPKSETNRLGIDRQRERSLVGSLTNTYKFKPGGMMKKTFSLTIGGVAQHLISYYKVEDVEQGRLRSPSTLPELASLDISPEYLDKTHFRNPPKVEIGVDGIPRYRGEADDSDTSPVLAPPLLLPPADDESASKRAVKRYDPYGTAAPKRPRKSKGGLASRSQESMSDEPSSPTYGSPIHTSPSYQETSLSATTTHQYAPYNYYSGYAYGSGYSAPPQSSYPPPPVSPLPHPQTPTPPPATSSPHQMTYSGYESSSAQPPSTQYSYYPPQSSYSYPSTWSGGYSSYGAQSHHSMSSHGQSSPDDDRKEDPDELDNST